MSNLSEDVYESIKRRLGSKDLKLGTKIKEGQLAEELEVSRTPLGEAINKLERGIGGNYFSRWNFCK